jgi:hypothetical protein
LGKISEAKELFKEMEIKGCSPSVVTYTGNGSHCCSKKALPLALFWVLFFFSGIFLLHFTALNGLIDRK